MKNFSELALNGKFTDFKKCMVSEMARRMNNHPIINEYNRQMDYYTKVSKYVSQIPSITEYKM